MDNDLSEEIRPAPGGMHMDAQGTGAGSDAPDERAKRPRRRRRRGRGKDPDAWTVEQFQVPEQPGSARFHDLGLPDKIMHAIADLGFLYCTPIQAKTLVHANAGQNISGRAQTGTGKTAAFLISIFSRFLREPIHGERPKGTPRALVLAPTRELVVQITKDATDLGKYCHFHCLAVYGGLELGKQRSALERHAVDLIVATPGRLLDFMKRGNIRLDQITDLVIDEADRMLDMGFIPDIRRIMRQVPHKSKRRTMLFSATLTDDVLRLASQWMEDPVICEVEPEKVTVDAVDQVGYVVSTRDKFRVLYHLLGRCQGKRVLIFCNRRDRTQALATRLRAHGVTCDVLSGDVTQKKRLKILDGFRDGSITVVVATDVAGRGLHVKEINMVVNFEFPYEPEDYVHRIGRTGRAGETGTAVSFACEDESFIIPAIEKYIGRGLPCRMPEPDLLEPVPHAR